MPRIKGQAPKKRPWTPLDERRLVFGWGVVPLPVLMKRLNRTRMAIIRRALDMKLGGLRRGHKSLAQVSRETGHARAVLEKVAATLKIQFRRIERGERPYKTDNLRSIAVSYEQEQRIIRYLKEHRHFKWHYPPGSKRSNGGVWGTGQKPPCCIRCGRTSKPHYAKGKCHPCYSTLAKQTKRANASGASQPTPEPCKPASPSRTREPRAP